MVQEVPQEQPKPKVSESWYETRPTNDVAQRFEHLQHEFQGGLSTMRRAMAEQDQQFQRQFEQLLTLNARQDRDRKLAHEEIADLKDQITQ